MKRKIIITFDDADQDAELALMRTIQIISLGYISVVAGLPHYSWVTTWELDDHQIVALAKTKKNAASADSIEFVKENKDDTRRLAAAPEQGAPVVTFREPSSWSFTLPDDYVSP